MSVKKDKPWKPKGSDRGLKGSLTSSPKKEEKKRGMNIPHRQTQTAVEAPEGEAQRREFGLLGVEREMTTMKMLLRFKKPWKIGNKRDTLKGEKQTKTLQPPACRRVHGTRE